MKIVYNKIIPPKGFVAINLFGVLFVRTDATLKVSTINHENIHTKQMQEMLYIFFYMWYVIEWFIKLIYYFNWKKAYRNISFEREAFANQDDADYLNNRKHYNWIKRI